MDYTFFKAGEVRDFKTSVQHLIRSFPDCVVEGYRLIDEDTEAEILQATISFRKKFGEKDGVTLVANVYKLEDLPKKYPTVFLVIPSKMLNAYKDFETIEKLKVDHRFVEFDNLISTFLEEPKVEQVLKKVSLA